MAPRHHKCKMLVVMYEVSGDLNRIFDGFLQGHIGFDQAASLLEAYYRKLPPGSQKQFFDILAQKLLAEKFSHLNSARTPHELIIWVWSAFRQADHLPPLVFALLRWDDPTTMESWAVKIGGIFNHSLFTHRRNFSKATLDGIKAQCLLFTDHQSPQLIGTKFPPSVVEVAERIQRTIDKINFDEFAGSITGPVQTPLVSVKGEVDPAITQDDYENILKTLSNMAWLMEQHPGAFENMKEEHLRAHFLVQLNGQYGGAATGETFNCQGKTDILIKEKGRNVFVAECKFWRGEKFFLDTINQHLSYLTWRDTRSAILIFNRNSSFSEVLEKIQAIIPTHELFNADLGKLDETSFRYSFCHPSDPTRLCVVSLLAFNVPTPRAPGND
jgi:hypothetical protein